jgi:hypothetical protein
MPLKKGTSEKTFVKNLKTEMEHGHPQKQSLAIAYAMKRKAAAAKRKKMADGGSTSEPTGPDLPGAQAFQASMRKATHYAGGEEVLPEMPAMEKGRHECHEGCYAEGGHAEHMGWDYSGPGSYAEGGFLGEEMASGYLHEPANDVKLNHMAAAEDAKRLNKHMPDFHESTEEADDSLVDRIMMNRKENNAGEAKFSEGGRVANFTPAIGGSNDNEFDDLYLRDELESTYGEDNNAGDDLGNEQEDERRRDLVDRIMLKDRKKSFPRGYPGR